MNPPGIDYTTFVTFLWEMKLEEVSHILNNTPYFFSDCA